MHSFHMTGNKQTEESYMSFLSVAQAEFPGILDLLAT